MKLGQLLIFIAALSQISTLKRPFQRNIKTFRSLKHGNIQRMNYSRKLEETAFIKNPLIFGVENPDDIKVDQTTQFISMASEISSYKEKVRQLTFLITGYKHKILGFKTNFEERITQLNDLVDTHMSEMNSI